MPIKTVYTIKRSREGKITHWSHLSLLGGPKPFDNLDAMLKALREILVDREKSGFLGKIWLTIEAHKEDQ